MNPIQLRKQLLLAESELNRAQLVADITALRMGAHTLAARARSFRAIASTAAVLVAALAAFRGRKSADAAAKPSWLQTLLKSASLISTIWLACRSQGRDQNEVT
jgi:hypothetical protein